jgi:hypothetical protein
VGGAQAHIIPSCNRRLCEPAISKPAAFVRPRKIGTHDQLRRLPLWSQHACRSPMVHSVTGMRRMAAVELQPSTRGAAEHWLRDTSCSRIRKARSTVPVPEPRRGVRCERHGPKESSSCRFRILHPVHLTRGQSRIRTWPPHDCNRPPIRQHLCDMNPTTHLTLQHDQLMPERGILCLKSAFRPEERGNHLQEEEYQCGHRGRRGYAGRCAIPGMAVHIA